MYKFVSRCFSEPIGYGTRQQAEEISYENLKKAYDDAFDDARAEDERIEAWFEDIYDKYDDGDDGDDGRTATGNNFNDLEHDNIRSTVQAYPNNFNFDVSTNFLDFYEKPSKNECGKENYLATDRFNDDINYNSFDTVKTKDDVNEKHVNNQLIEETVSPDNHIDDQVDKNQMEYTVKIKNQTKANAIATKEKKADGKGKSADSRIKKLFDKFLKSEEKTAGNVEDDKDANQNYQKSSYAEKKSQEMSSRAPESKVERPRVANHNDASAPAPSQSSEESGGGGTNGIQVQQPVMLQFIQGPGFNNLSL